LPNTLAVLAAVSRTSNVSDDGKTVLTKHRDGRLP
jgi:hypothetical protein